MTISRRSFLIGGAATAGVVVAGAAGGYALVEAEVVPGKSWLDEVSGRCGDPLAPPDVEPGPVVEASYVSTTGGAGGTRVGWSVLYPPGHGPGDALRICWFLHGRGGDHTDAAGPMHLDRFLAGAVRDGAMEPFAIVAVDGGDAVNWHRRADGADPVFVIRDEVTPRLDDMGLITRRPAFWGVSLGGAGALYMATLDGVAAAGVVAASPALWRWPGEWQPGTYDGDADFAATNLWDRRDRLTGVDLRIDCGASDPFVDRVREFRDSLDPTPAGGIEDGCHDGRYWSRQTPAELAFLGAALAAHPVTD